MIVRNLILPAIFIVTYLGIVDATKGLSSKRGTELDTITPLTETENEFLVTLFNRGIFKHSETANNSDNADEQRPVSMSRRLSSKKSKKGSADSNNSRRHAHKLEHTT